MESILQGSGKQIPDDQVPQYRLHNPNAKRGGYHFTGSTEERDLLISFGWILQPSKLVWHI